MRVAPRRSCIPSLRRTDRTKAQACIDDAGAATAFLAHDVARRPITGETLYIDGGYHIIG